MEAMQGWLAGSWTAPGALEVAGKLRVVADRLSEASRALASSCARCLVQLGREVQEGHLPLEYMVAGGVLVALTVIAFLYRRSRRAPAKAAQEGGEGKVPGGRPEPEGREETRQEGRPWKRPQGVKNQQAEVPPPEPAWRKKCAAKPAEVQPKKPAAVTGKFQLSQPLEHVTTKKVEPMGKVEEPPKKNGWFGSKSSNTSEEAKPVEEPKKSSWFGSKTNDPPKEAKVDETEKKSGWFGSKSADAPKQKEAETKSGLFGKSSEDSKKKVKVDQPWKARANLDEEEEAKKFAKELAEVERKAVESAKNSMRSVRLNIDKNPRSIDESKKKKEMEVLLVKQMCGEFKATMKLDEKAAAAREEKKKDLDQVRSARSFFKTVDRERSLSAVPRIRFRTEEEFSDSYSRGNRQRLSQFEPGKIHSRFSDIFEQTSEEGAPSVRPPKKKLITLDEKNSEVREEISSLGGTPVKARYKPEAQKQERPLSAEIKDELNDIRESRPTPVTKRWNPTQESKGPRSQSAHTMMRTRLPDSSWVVERSASRLEEERQKALQELEEVKKARQETLEVIENGELERPSSRAEIESRNKALKELEEVKLVQLSHEKRVQDSYKTEAKLKQEKEKEANYRNIISAQRSKRESALSENGGEGEEAAAELADLTMEDIALAIAMESLDDIDGILTRLNQPDSEDQDLDNLTSEMENLVGKAEQIEANIENIENMGSEVQIVVKDYDESEDDKSLDEEVCNITSDLGNCGRRGSFEPGRISDNFMRKFDTSRPLSEEVPMPRPKKKLITFDQVMRKTPSLIEDAKHQRHAELEEIRNVRKSWAPPDESELTFNQISKSSTVPGQLKIKSVYCNDQVEPAAEKEERRRELLELKQSRSGEVRRVGKGDISWIREPTAGGGERSRTQAELAALREVRSELAEEIAPLYSTRQEVEEKARIQRELEQLRGNKGSTVRGIKKELEDISLRVAVREEESEERVFTDPTVHWEEERRRIQEEVQQPTTSHWQEEEEPLYSLPNKATKKAQVVMEEQQPEVVMPEMVTTSEDVVTEVKKTDTKIKEKLALLKKQTQDEVVRMKEKTSGLVSNLRAQKEEARGRSRKVKSEESQEEHTTLRAKSISTIKNAGLKMKELTSGGGKERGKKRKL